MSTAIIGGYLRNQAGAEGAGAFAEHARRDSDVELGLHDLGLVTVVNGSERGVAVPYDVASVSTAQNDTVARLSRMFDGAEVFADTFELGGHAWVYFVEDDGSYMKVCLDRAGRFYGLSRCEANRWNPDTESNSGEYDITDDPFDRAAGVFHRIAIEAAPHTTTV